VCSSSMREVVICAGAAVAGYLLYRKRCRRSEQTGGPPGVVNDARVWADLQSTAADEAAGFFAFYSSVTNAVTTRPELMTVAVHDHAIVRGHAVFDTCSLAKRRLYRLRIHLDRLFASAAAAKLPLPFKGDEPANRSRMTEVIRAACIASGRQDADVRFWLTAGTGNLGVTPKGCRPAFYVLVFGGLPTPTSWSVEGIPEASVPQALVPMKPPLLAELKSNNYMLNALTMMAAQERGGTFGIGVDTSGHLTESCVLNVMVVGPDRVLRTPPFEGILRGTTARRAMELATRNLLVGSTEWSAAGQPPRQRNQLAAVRQEPITLDDAQAGLELILVAGDTHVFACTSLDGRPVGDGKPGPVWQSLVALLKADATAGHEDHDELI